MRVDVVFTPAGLTAAEVHGKTVFVVDILRATTSMCAALNNGAKAIIPVASTEEALRLSQTIGSTGVVLAGEQGCLKIPGFQLGNSPLEMTGQAVRERRSSSRPATAPKRCSPVRVRLRSFPRRLPT